MTETAPGRGFYLRKALRQGAEGLYVPSTGARTVSLGEDHASPLAKMVSFHESFHSLLNASTTFGMAMVFAGALERAGDPDMGALVARMIEACLVTHETYATMSGIYLASEATYDRGLLDSYPSYQGYFDSMAAVLDLDGSPFISSLCIAAAARVAMQVDILDRWKSIPCSGWAATSWAEGDAPDVRFGLVTGAESIAAVQKALGTALTDAAPAIRKLARGRLGREERLRAVVEAPLPEQEALQAVAFRAMAEACFPDEERRPVWLAQRRLAADLIAKVQDRAGDRLGRRFLASTDLEGDFDATFIEARAERLVVWPGRIPALLDPRGEFPKVTPSDFVTRYAGFRPHVQLIGIPCDKLPALYELRDPLPEGPPRRTITALRRFVSTPSLSVRGIVHMLELNSPDDLSKPALGEEDPQVFALVCASALADQAWTEEWFGALAGLGAATAILIDVDPFGLIPAMAEKSRLKMVGTMLESGEFGLPSNIHIVSFADDDDDSSLLLFSPCSELFTMSFGGMVERAGWNVDLEGSLSEAQLGLLQIAIGHALIEEPRFGFCQWWRDDDPGQ